MCTPDANTSKVNRIAYVGVVSIILLLNVVAFIAHVLFFVKFLSTDLQGALFAFMTIWAYFIMMYTVINAISLKSKMNQIFEKLTEICCESE